MTWAPGMEMCITDRLVSEGGWIQRNGVTCLNLYRPPNVKPGDPDKAGPWLDHVKKVFPNDAHHIVPFLAHRVQHPDIKINHGLVLGGAQGTGKDTLLEPVKYAVGPWNFREVGPTQVMGRFNGFLKSVVLRISEARDLGEFDRYKFYEHMKAYMAAPPDVLLVDEKHLREYWVSNVCGIIVTTNHKSGGIYLDADDRRHYVAWSDLTKESFGEDEEERKAYWNKIWGWYRKGGKRHVAAYLAELDLSDFDAKAPPEKTDAFWAIVGTGRAPEVAELADVLDGLGKPEAVTLDMIREEAATTNGSFHEWINDRKNRWAFPHHLEKCGYTQIQNKERQDRLFVVGGNRQVIYVKSELEVGKRLEAAKKLCK